VIELILSESLEVLRTRRDVVIVVHRSGFVMANAGIDFSNVDAGAPDESVLLLPLDPDWHVRADTRGAARAHASGRRRHHQ
jgi:coenzyme F420-0:L-glutamate ligase/coenzyme F420-1:gamma-L-glutamate ligase